MESRAAWCPGSLSQAGARLGDIVLVTEVQEILRREVVDVIRRCDSVALPAKLNLVRVSSG